MYTNESSLDIPDRDHSSSNHIGLLRKPTGLAYCRAAGTITQEVSPLSADNLSGA
jgi:hypothetical protein